MKPLSERHPLGRTGLSTPAVIFGSSALGNLYRELPIEEKQAIASEWFRTVEAPVVIDSAGKYGAGLALESLGRLLAELEVSPDRVVISNKLGWRRTALRGSEPTFEPGVWKGLAHDAEQAISREGIHACWEQGCELLGGRYRPALVSVHDPDEYLAVADERERGRRFEEVVAAYETLAELKAAGEVVAVGLGAKEWRVIREISRVVELDWVMFACSLTVHTHPAELLEFLDELTRAGVGIINSAVFNAGFLIGGEYFDYRRPDPDTDAELFRWRDQFLEACAAFEVKPADACVEFALSPPGVSAVALNTSNPKRVAQNVESVRAKAPSAFWHRLKRERLIDTDYPHIG